MRGIYIVSAIFYANKKHIQRV